METDFSYGVDPSVATQIDPGAAAGLAMLAGGMALFVLFFAIIMYVYFAICLMKIAKKTNTDNAWLAWIPIANLVLMIKIAQKPMWWLALFLLMFIPVVGAIAMMVIMVLLWMEISEKVGKEKWLGILWIIPIANLVLPGYLAFSKSEGGSKPSVAPENSAE
jgi:hypothetical protein